MVAGVPLVLLSAGAFTAGVVVSGESGERDAVERFGAAWENGDFSAMHAELTAAAQDEFPAEELERRYAEAEQVATADGLDVGDTRGPFDQDDDTLVALAVSIPTTSFGTIEGEIGLPVAGGAIEWQPNLVFPGLAEDQKLDRRTQVPKRAPILAADRSALAEGPADARTTNGTGGIVAGEVGEPAQEQAEEMLAAGFPEGSAAGITGLELAFDSVLAGTPGGQLLATGGGSQVVLAQSEPENGEPLRTTIVPKLQDATAAALGASYGGAALLDARNGELLAVAGLGFSAPQPPGSTMKVITLTGALEAEITDPDEEFPVVASAIVGGREVGNADDELCGGTLVRSFADSCNSVFGPLGEELGGERLVETSELFGFNSPPTLYNSDSLAEVELAESTIPKDLADAEAGISAIGQGEVLATPLEMASVAQTIANDGVRSPTSLVKDSVFAGDYPDVEVTTPQIAEQVTQMMVEVVKSGTGVAAALPDATVAGKSGTAELGTTSDEPVGSEPAELDVNAWFLAFAPAEKPKFAVAVMLINADGGGGTVAAPIASAILDAAL